MSKINLDLVAAKFQEGLQLLNNGEYLKAQEKFFRVIEIDRRHAEAYVGLGLSMEKTGKQLEALKMYKKAIKFDPKNTVAVYNLGVVYLGFDQFYKAQRQFKKTLKIQPKNPNALHNLGLIYHNKKKYKKAIKFLLEAVETHGEKVYAIHYLLAKSYLAQKRVQESIFHLQKSLDDRADFLPSLFELLKIYQERGEWLSFFEVVRKVSTICPHNQVLHDEILKSLETIREKNLQLEGFDEKKLDKLITEFKTGTIQATSGKQRKRTFDLQPKVLVAEPEEGTPRIYH